MKRSYPFHDLNPDDFERLVIHVCMKILGTGTIVFAAGKDGGRDGTFDGTAEKFPSAAAPLSGRFVIQSKHNSNPNSSCSDKEFESVVNCEVPKLKALLANDELDHYMIFTNRKKPAEKAIKAEKALKKLKLKTAHIFGREQIREWLTANHDVWKNLGFDRFDAKFEVGPKDLAEVVQAFHGAVKSGADGVASATDFGFVLKRKKNKINGLSAAYDQYIRESSLKYFSQIEAFLKNPRNEVYRDYYHDTADELKAQIVANKAEFKNFDDVLIHVHDQVSSVPGLRRHRRYVRHFLHYMYWTCDIGQHDHAKQTS